MDGNFETIIPQNKRSRNNTKMHFWGNLTLWAVIVLNCGSTMHVSFLSVFQDVSQLLSQSCFQLQDLGLLGFSQRCEFLSFVSRFCASPWNLALPRGRSRWRWPRFVFEGLHSRGLNMHETAWLHLHRMHEHFSMLNMTSPAGHKQQREQPHLLFCHHLLYHGLFLQQLVVHQLFVHRLSGHQVFVHQAEHHWHQKAWWSFQASNSPKKPHLYALCPLCQPNYQIHLIS